MCPLPSPHAPICQAHRSSPGPSAARLPHRFVAGITRGFQPISNAPKSVQSVLSRVQHRIQQQRLRILLAAAKDDPVDVQIGPQLYEDAPQVRPLRLRQTIDLSVLPHFATFEAM